jgi:hypothetical protein
MWSEKPLQGLVVADKNLCRHLMSGPAAPLLPLRSAMWGMTDRKVEIH